MIETLIGVDKTTFYALFTTGVPLVLLCFAVVYMFIGKIILERSSDSLHCWILCCNKRWLGGHAAPSDEC